jgi:phosphoribosylglycinamide formyltransferase-1
MMAIKLIVLLSGSGTTLQNLIDRIAAKTLNAEIVLVVSSRTGVKGLERAKAAGIPTVEILKKGLTTEVFGQRIYEKLRATPHDLVCLAGFLEFLPIPEDFTHRVINIHPSLIPAFSGKGFYGKHVHEAALNAGVKVSGCTVHFADNEFDHGPILLQKVVPVLDGDTPEALANRVFAAECEALPEAITLIARKQIRVEGHRTVQLHAPTGNL